jgi:hypothetical protein
MRASAPTLTLSTVTTTNNGPTFTPKINLFLLIITLL